MLEIGSESFVRLGPQLMDAGAECSPGRIRVLMHFCCLRGCSRDDPISAELSTQPKGLLQEIMASCAAERRILSPSELGRVPLIFGAVWSLPLIPGQPPSEP
jgi:hypothetical protein